MFKCWYDVHVTINYGSDAKVFKCSNDITAVTINSTGLRLKSSSTVIINSTGVTHNVLLAVTLCIRNGRIKI